MGMGVATLTTSNLAKLSGLSIDKIRRLAFKGALKAIRTTGGHRRFSITQVNKAKKFIRRRKLLSGGNNVISEAHGLNSFMAYVLGLLFADGNVTKKKQVQLELKDRQILDDIAKRLGCVVHKRKTRKMYRITIPAKYARELLQKFNLVRRKSDGFIVPYLSENAFIQVLRGWFDGDGSISKKRKNGKFVFSLYGHPKSLSYVQKTLLEHFNLYIPWYFDGEKKDFGFLNTNKRETLLHLFDILYSDGSYLCLERKRKIFKEFMNKQNRV